MDDEPIVPMQVRMPHSLRVRIGAAAKANRRSVNGEVIVMLEAAMAAENKPPASADGATAAGQALPA